MPMKEGKIYALGGQFTGTCEVYDVKTNNWKLISGYGNELPENDLQTFSLLTL